MPVRVVKSATGAKKTLHENVATAASRPLTGRIALRYACLLAGFSRLSSLLHCRVNCMGVCVVEVSAHECWKIGLGGVQLVVP